jgi:hypothetical protein
MLYPTLQLIGTPPLCAADADGGGYFTRRIEPPPLPERDANGGSGLGRGVGQVPVGLDRSVRPL